MLNNSTESHNTSGNDSTNPTATGARLVTVPLSEARDGDRFRGIIQRGGVIIAAAGPIQIRMGRPYLSGMVPFLDNEVWEHVTVTREVPTAREEFEELAIGTEFQIGGEGYATYVKVSDDLFAKMPLRPGENYLYGTGVLSDPDYYLTTREPAPEPKSGFQPGDRVIAAPREGSAIAHLAGLPGCIEGVHATQPRHDDTLYIVSLDGSRVDRRYLFASELRREED